MSLGRKYSIPGRVSPIHLVGPTRLNSDPRFTQYIYGIYLGFNGTSPVYYRHDAYLMYFSPSIPYSI